MGQLVARLGDRISHGGEIIEASPDVRANGKRVARLGDRVFCVRHGTQTITGASNKVRANSKRVARVGDRVSCGATITTGARDVRAG